MIVQNRCIARFVALILLSGAFCQHSHFNFVEILRRHAQKFVQTSVKSNRKAQATTSRVQAATVNHCSKHLLNLIYPEGHSLGVEIRSIV